MKFHHYLVFLLLLGCASSSNILMNKKLSKEIYKQQIKLSGLAEVTLLSREENISGFSQLNLEDKDTLFLIERISEPDLQYWCNIWSTKRDKVIEYSNLDGAKTSKTLEYTSWNIKLKDLTERFDTTKIETARLLGGYKTFISVVDSKRVRTFWFSDKYSSFDE